MGTLFSPGGGPKFATDNQVGLDLSLSFKKAKEQTTVARIPREDLVSETQSGVYLCSMHTLPGTTKKLGGTDKGGRSFDHRRKWIIEQLEVQAELMAMDVVGYSVLPRTLTLLLRTRPDVAKGWSDAEVARRYQAGLYSKVPFGEKRKTAPAEEVSVMLESRVEMRRARSRLSSLTWFVGQLTESTARNCNREDENRGRFWEGRYHCLPLLDVQATAAAIGHVDLEPLIAGEATTLAGCKFSSAKLRSAPGKSGFLAPVTTGASKNKDLPNLLTVTDAELVKVLEWSSRQSRRFNDAALSDEIAAIFEKLKIRPAAWLVLVREFRDLFHRAAGNVDSLDKIRKKRGLQHLHGLAASRELFA
ncbi:MAG TPA: hypothetical protein DDY91_22280 [Planctomycetaceae bacterium]|nr:hypothetical protein [Planctomycetaceae bacterium]